MSEKLLSRLETAQRLCMSPRTFDRHRPRLIAMGLQKIDIGQKLRFREASVDKVIRNLAENGG